MTKEVTLDIKDIFDLDIDDLPSVEQQKAMVEEIERLRAEGKSDAESIRLVLEHNRKLH